MLYNEKGIRDPVQEGVGEMIFFVTALYQEARPLIQRFQLKKVEQTSKFQIFEGEDAALIISGPGMISAAAATSHLLTRYRAGRTDVVINGGICGTVDLSSFSMDAAVLCHKIIHHDSGRTFYPDIFIHHSFSEGSLETFAVPVDRGMLPHIQGDLVDMEGAGFFEAASAFVGPHQIGLVKIVSDALDPRQPSPEQVIDRMERHLDRIVDYVRTLQQVIGQEKDILSDEDHELLRQVSRRLRLSTTLEHQLFQMARKFRLSHQQELVDVLQPYLQIDIESKQEGKMRFEELRQKCFDA